MTTPTLAEYIALHDQLAALVRAGVPVHLGLPSRGSSATAAFERIGAAVARRVGEGASVHEALEDRAVPAAYRSVAQLALESGELATAIDGASRQAAAQDESWYAVRMALRYPLVVCLIAYVGIVLFCLLLVPILESTYESMRIAPGWGLTAVTALRDALPFWVAVPPIALLLTALCLRRARERGAASAAGANALAWLPGMSQIVRKQRLARFAETLAGHLEAGASLGAGLQAAANAWENDALARETLALAAELNRGEVLRDSAPLAASLPPLLRWAIWQADATVGRPRALRMAADSYRRWAQHRIQRLRVLAPALACIVVGGGVALAYALALFVPVIQMLERLAG